MESNVIMSCQLKVDTQSSGWQKTMTKILSSIKGVSYTIDVERGVANVTGTTDPKSLMKLLSKSSKHTELLWLDFGGAAPSNHAPLPTDQIISPTNSLLLPSHNHRSYHCNTYDLDYYHPQHNNYHPVYSSSNLGPTLTDHYPAYWPQPSADVHQFPQPPSLVMPHPRSTCSIM